MKKLILILFAFIVAGMIKVNAENHRIYAVFVVDGSSGAAVLIQETTNGGNIWGGFKFKENCIRDNNGKELKFNNFLPALGYMETLGWTIPDIQDQIVRNMSNAINGDTTFLLYKDVSESEWLKWIENGIRNK